jgi:uncharacterized protein (DUF2147 family)
MNLPDLRHRRLFLQWSGAILLLAGSSGGASAAPSPVGQWTVANGQASIRVVDCGGRYWGFVASEQKPGGTDKNNPNPAMRRRPTLGMPILLGLTPGNQPATWSGQIYNSQDGRTYSGRIRLTGHDTLHVEGCVLGFLCGGEDWRRASAGHAEASRRRGHTAGPATTGSAVADEPAAKVCSSLAR